MYYIQVLKSSKCKGRYGNFLSGETVYLFWRGAEVGLIAIELTHFSDLEVSRE